MVKYRRLTDEELKELEQEFKQFLITNAVYDQEWKELNKSNPEKAMALVDQFSDLVLEKSLESIKYIIHTNADSLKVFWYRKDKAQLIGLNCSSPELDFSKEDWMLNIPEQVNGISCFKQEKEVKEGNRSNEIFSLIDSGAEVCDERLYKFVHELVKDQV